MSLTDPMTLAALIAAPFFGSFAMSCGLRLAQARPLAWARSACPHCDHRLAARDLLPLVSWLAARGRCRYCGAKIGYLYPAAEIAAFGVALWAALLQSGWLLWASCGLGWALIALAIADWRAMVLPDALTLPLLVAGLAVAYGQGGVMPVAGAIGAAAGYLVFRAIAAGYRRLRGQAGLGPGDAKLVAAGGAWVGWQGLSGVVLIAAVATLAAVAAARLTGRHVARHQHLPFGPALCLGIWVVWLYGPVGLWLIA